MLKGYGPWNKVVKFISLFYFCVLNFLGKGRSTLNTNSKTTCNPLNQSQGTEINASSLSLENNPILGKSCNSVIYTIPVNKINTAIIRQTREPLGQSTTKSGKVLPISHISYEK